MYQYKLETASREPVENVDVPTKSTSKFTKLDNVVPGSNINLGQHQESQRKNVDVSTKSTSSFAKIVLIYQHIPKLHKESNLQLQI